MRGRCWRGPPGETPDVHAVTPRSGRSRSGSVEIGQVEIGQFVERLRVDVERERQQPMEPARRVGRERRPLAVFDDASVIEHDDLVDVAQRRQPVRDHQRRAAAHERRDRCLQRGLGGRVDPGGRLVEHEQIRVAQPHAGEREQLCLAGRQPCAAGAELAVDAAVGERVEADRAERDRDRLVGGLGIEQGDVVAHRAGEQLHLLRDQRDAAAEFPFRDLPDRHVAEEHLARRSRRRGAAPDATASSCRCRCVRRRRPIGRRRCADRWCRAPVRRRRRRVAMPPRRRDRRTPGSPREPGGTRTTPRAG